MVRCPGFQPFFFFCGGGVIDKLYSKGSHLQSIKWQPWSYQISEGTMAFPLFQFDVSQGEVSSHFAASSFVIESLQSHNWKLTTFRKTGCFLKGRLSEMERQLSGRGFGYFQRAGSFPVKRWDGSPRPPIER